MTTPPFDYAPRSGAWMIVSDVFSIKGRGTVITGRLEGDGLLGVGDIAVCEGMRWKVSKIEMFRAELMTAEPGQNIGVLLKTDPPRGMLLRNRLVQFESDDGGGAMGPQFSELEPRKKRWRR